jgi:hypothetical protein
MISSVKKVYARFRSRIPFFLIIIAAYVLLSAGTGAAQGGPTGLQIRSLQLIQMDPVNDQPLFHLEIVGKDDKGVVPIPAEVDIRNRLKIIQLRPYKAYSPVSVITSGKETRTERYVLILFDLSGSMKEATPGAANKFEAAKGAVLKILEQFDPHYDHLAIAPFESHRVVEKIRGARFNLDKKEAIEEMNKWPPPTNGNTGLFSAIDAGLELISSQNSSAKHYLIVMTDGKNDVNHPGDDANLLQDSDLNRVVDRIRSLQIPVYPVLFAGGASDEPAMRKVANPESSLLSPRDKEKLESAFKEIASGMIDNIQVLIRPDVAHISELNLAQFRFRAEIAPDSGMPLLKSQDEPWYAPNTGPVRFRYASKEELNNIRKHDVVVAGGPPKDIGQPLPAWVPLLVYGGVILICWFFVPRFIWPDYASASKAYGARPPQSMPPVRGGTPGPPAGGGWRTQTGRSTGRLRGSPRTNVGPGPDREGPRH